MKKRYLIVLFAGVLGSSASVMACPHGETPYVGGVTCSDSEGTEDSRILTVNDATVKVTPKDMMNKMLGETQAKVEPAKDKVSAEDNNIALGKALFATCAGCHGSDGTGGVGPDISKLSKKDVYKKLNAYKNGQVNSPMAAMMQPQAENLNEKEIKALSAYVDSLS